MHIVDKKSKSEPCLQLGQKMNIQHPKKNRGIFFVILGAYFALQVGSGFVPPTAAQLSLFHPVSFLSGQDTSTSAARLWSA